MSGFGGYPGFAVDPPHEMVEELKRQHAKRVDFRNSIRHMMKELDTHHLWVLKNMLNGAVSSDDAQMRVGVAHFLGMLTAHLELRDTCPGCGVDRIEEDLKEMDPEITLQQGPPSIETDVSDHGVSAHGETMEEITATLEIRAAMDAYAVRADPTPDEPGRVRCTGICQGTMTWPTLDDRMDEKPNLCPQCAEKGKWG